MKVNERVLKLIEDGLNRADDMKGLALKAGCSYAYLYQLRAGKKKKISVHMADRILSALDLSVDIGVKRKGGNKNDVQRISDNN